VLLCAFDLPGLEIVKAYFAMLNDFPEACLQEPHGI
jgi:hypothetical protein